ncbi:MAG: prepilin-type N-terminal cleavage/methylation domain-containing protein [Candidatus Pacebacteria bacterium]|nr:prepilin-type N-terminal cleavage/methylation domain-containing protein [Candidatus Paceibacterota bacterium]
MKNKGLTLVELLVVISIIIIATGVIVINGSSKDSIDLYNAANTLRQNISKAKEMAMSGVGASPDTNYGIGVWVTGANEYIIYKNAGKTAYNYGGSDVILDKVTLGDGLVFKNTDKGALFVPPTPYVALCTGTSCINTGSLEFGVCKTGLTSCHLITINAAGLIE